MRAAGALVEVHGDHFSQGTKDKVWLTEVGHRGWIVVTHDTRIRYRQTELDALFKARVRAFVLTARDVTGPDIAAALVEALPRMLRFSVKHPPPFIAKVTRGGSVSMLKIP